MLVVWITFVLLVSALASAMTLGWRRHAVRAEPVKAEIEGPTCYPRVKR